MKAKENKSPKFKYKRKIKIPLGDYGELVMVWRGASGKELLEFSVAYRVESNGKWYTIRRHCWTLHQDRFHTHVRVGLGKDDIRIIYPPPLRGSIKRALNWAKEDMKQNWYIYLQSFNKLVINRKGQK
jgi:hypothetical protein